MPKPAGSEPSAKPRAFDIFVWLPSAASAWATRSDSHTLPEVCAACSSQVLRTTGFVCVGKLWSSEHFASAWCSSAAVPVIDRPTEPSAVRALYSTSKRRSTAGAGGPAAAPCSAEAGPPMSTSSGGCPVEGCAAGASLALAEPRPSSPSVHVSRGAPKPSGRWLWEAAAAFEAPPWLPGPRRPPSAGAIEPSKVSCLLSDPTATRRRCRASSDNVLSATKPSATWFLSSALSNICDGLPSTTADDTESRSGASNACSPWESAPAGTLCDHNQ
mmetsp:Transcript_132437/g.423904  ORF Transcript_132437/g.423904 Transcript_132437/m.423904 type:complete len:273 (+) Transcript_132437:294-1112(+)